MKLRFRQTEEQGFQLDQMIYGDTALSLGMSPEMGLAALIQGPQTRPSLWRALEQQ